MAAVESARSSDAPLLLQLRQGREGWMAHRGIDQWEPNSRSLEWFERSVDQDVWYVIRDGQRLKGAVRIAWRDPAVWGERDTDALYVHDLMVATAAAGEGLGQLLLRDGERMAEERGVHLARLDCMEQNHLLVDYYARCGFVVVGRTASPYPHRGGWVWGALMEKQLS